MWQLNIKRPADKEWSTVGTFDTVTEAARLIRNLESSSANGLFLEFYVETDHYGTDEEAFRVFHYTGTRALYGIKRCRPN